MGAGERGDHAADAIVFEQDAEFALARAAVVRDRGQVARALAVERLDQVVRKSRATEAAEEDAGAGGQVGDGGVGGWVDLLSHARILPGSRASRKSRARRCTPTGSWRDVRATPARRRPYGRPSLYGPRAPAGPPHHPRRVRSAGCAAVRRVRRTRVLLRGVCAGSPDQNAKGIDRAAYAAERLC